MEPDFAEIAVVDYGSQYSQLIVRRLREIGYFSRLYLPDQWEEIDDPRAVILSGGPRSVGSEEAPGVDYRRLRNREVPVLGICYGMQLLAVKSGGEVTANEEREYGPAEISVTAPDTLFEGVPERTTVWMSHSDSVSRLPEGGTVLAKNERGVPVAVRFEDDVFGLQFHPEVSHTPEGERMLRNFLSLMEREPDFSMSSYRDLLLDEISRTVGDREVLCGVSGGVDSTVLATLLHESGADVRCVFVDTGLLRKNEPAEVRGQFEEIGIEIEMVDASDRFLDAIEGVSDPEEKRNIIGELFLDEFFGHVDQVEMLAQGTLYPDVIESATSDSDASTIKTHHNRVQTVLELEEEGRVLEPFNELFKDEVRRLGETLDIPRRILNRHPFPGPGLAIRVPGPVTRPKLSILREADDLFVRTLREWDWYDNSWQAFVVLLPVKTVGVKGDERSYEFAVSVRSVSSEDGMTADWSRLPYDLLQEVSNRILNEVDGVNRVLYDVSTKPPSSIEWE